MSITRKEAGGRERASFVCDATGTSLTIRIRGEIDHHTATAVRQDIDAILFQRKPSLLRLDLSAVSFMDSSGLGLIMGRFSVMRELGGSLVVWNPSPETRSILNLAGMERLVRIEYPAGEEPPPTERTRVSVTPAARSHRPRTQAAGQRSGRTPARSGTGSNKPSTRKEKDA